jgi:copper(I)-binding protein
MNMKTGVTCMTIRLSFSMATLATAMLITTSAAHAVLSINEPWVRPAADGRTAEVFVKLRSSEDAVLASVDSFAARRIEMRGNDGRIAVKSIALPANAIVELKPGQAHLKLVGLHRRLKLGEHVPVTFIITSAGDLKQTVHIDAEVRKRSPSEDEMDAHGSNAAQGAHGTPGHHH